MISYLIFSFFIILSAWTGYRRGMIVIFSRITGIIASYILAWLLTPIICQLLPQFGVTLHMGWYFFTGMLIFLLFYLCFVLAGFWVHIAITHKRKRNEVRRSYWIVGSFLNLLPGCLYALLSIWALAQLKISQPIISPQNPLVKFTSSVLESALNSYLDTDNETDNNGEIVAKLLSHPKIFQQELQTLTQDVDFKAFFQNPFIQDLLSNRDTGRLIQTDEYKKFMSNPALKNSLSALGLHPEDSDSFAENLCNIWSKTHQLQNNPRAREIMTDPTVQDWIKNNDVIHLLEDPRLLELAQILTSPKPAPLESPTIREPLESPQAPIENTEPTQQKKLYSWRDKDGKLNITDYPPPEKETAHSTSEKRDER